MNKKINMDKVKQMTLVIFGVILLGVGFMNYKTDTEETAQKIAIVNTNTERTGDVELVSSNAIVENENIVTSAIVENETNEVTVESSDDYFSQTKLERDTMYSQMLESYQKIVDNKDLAETQKSIAVQEIDKINQAQNSIMIAENLIMNKGFENAVILVNNNVVNVVVKTAYLGNEDIGKIQNIIQREFDVDLEDVNISYRN
jgi:stage III sporulation protein AH